MKLRFQLKKQLVERNFRSVKEGEIFESLYGDDRVKYIKIGATKDDILVCNAVKIGNGQLSKFSSSAKVLIHRNSNEMVKLKDICDYQWFTFHQDLRNVYFKTENDEFVCLDEDGQDISIYSKDCIATKNWEDDVYLIDVVNEDAY